MPKRMITSLLTAAALAACSASALASDKPAALSTIVSTIVAPAIYGSDVCRGEQRGDYCMRAVNRVEDASVLEEIGYPLDNLNRLNEHLHFAAGTPISANTWIQISD